MPDEVREILDWFGEDFWIYKTESLISSQFAVFLEMMRVGFRLAGCLFFISAGIDFLCGDWKQGIITGFLGLSIYLNLKYGRFFEPKKEKNIE